MSLGLYALFALSVVSPLPPSRGGTPRPEIVPGSVLVRLRAQSQRSAWPLVLTGVRLQRPLTGGALQLVLQDRSPDATAQLLSRLQQMEEVVWAQPERYRYAQQAPVNDPHYLDQWALPLLQLPAAWQKTHGSPHVVVAVIDTGIRPHPELATRLVLGYDFISDPESAADGDGRDPDPTDPGSLEPGSSGLHGLHVSGIVGAQANNHEGIAGVDWNCRILPLRVLGVHDAGGRDSDIADAIRWAAGLPVAGVPDNPTPAHIINLSFGGTGDSLLLQEAIDAAGQTGAVVVASAGNDAADVADYAPAGLRGVIAVGAADERGGLAGYSNFGPRIDLLGPGGRTDRPESGVLSTTYQAGPSVQWGYFFLPGTSQAAAHVSGVAALLRAIAPQLPPDAVRQILKTTADSRKQCAAGCGAGLVDAAAAVAAAASAAGCEPACGLHEECVDRSCVAFTPLEVQVPGGCSATRTPDAAAPLALGVFITLALLRRRARRATASQAPPIEAAARHPAAQR